METITSYFIDELICDIKENPDLYKDMDIIQILEVVKSYDQNAGYDSFNDVKEMSDDERRDWMRECFGIRA